VSILGCSGQALAVASRDWVLQILIACCWHVELHLIGIIIGLLATTLWHNENFPCHNQMTIINLTHFDPQMGTMEANNIS
jgi:hypothetical protein